MFKYLLPLKPKEGLRYLDLLVAFEPYKESLAEALISSFEDEPNVSVNNMQIIYVEGRKEMSIDAPLTNWLSYKGVFIPGSTCNLFEHISPDEYRQILDSYPSPHEFFLKSPELLQPNTLVSFDIHAYADTAIIYSETEIKHERLIDFNRVIVPTSTTIH